MVLDGAACRLGGLGEVEDVLGFFGVDRVSRLLCVFGCRGGLKIE